MAKIKVHELAKELELQSKDILNFLQEKGIEAKAAQSSLEEDAAALVRNSLGQKKATAAPAVEKEATAKAENTKPVEEKAQEETKSPEETKKKKKIIFVSNPQNSKMPGQRQGGQNGQGQGLVGQLLDVLFHGLFHDTIRQSVRADRTDRDREMPADSVRTRDRITDIRTTAIRTILTITVCRHRLPYVPSSR